MKNFYNTYGYYYFRVWIINFLALVGLFLFDFIDIVYIALSAIIYLHLFTLVFHEWVSHGYIKPRFPFSKYFLLMILYSQDTTIQKKKNYHLYHHKNWQDPEIDPSQQKLKGISFFRYMFSFHKPVAQNIPTTEVSLLENDVVVKFLDRHGRLIYISLLILAFCILPFKWAYGFTIYFPCVVLLLSNFHDYYFHGPMEGKDRNFFTFLFSTQAWHVEHHTHWKDEYYGPRYWYLLNPTWYFRKLLFIKDERTT